ncbi:hypothetical protein [Seonamhaeicola sp.]|uniref:hypothetical protein n=1 Tax=Seonamhaeicola sp. TaxID=1912245 RepID=UPI0026161F9E|nr:hypothetical protein [Seonamhaeicola sp.]
MKFLLYTYIIIFPLNLISQSVLQTDFYSIEIPEPLTYEKFKSDKEDLSNTDVYKIIDTKKEKIKYLVYLMSNKLNYNAKTISEKNINEYLKDIGKSEILNIDKLLLKNKEVFKLKLSLDKEITGIVYLTSINDVLYRVLIMVPDKFFMNFKKEIDSICTNTRFLKDNWDS